MSSEAERKVLQPLLDKVEEFGTSYRKGIDQITERIEHLEATGDRPKGNLQGSADEREHLSKFNDWIRKPRDGMTKRILEEAEAEIQRKAVTIGTDASGGYAVPKLISQEIESRVRTQNPFRGLVREVVVGSTDFQQLVSKNQASSGWVGEGDTRSETTTSDLVNAKPTWGTIYAYPKASEESVADIFFDVGQWLVDEASDGFTEAEATAIWSGNGTNKPSGLINTTPVTTGDSDSPERAATALRYLPLTNGSPILINADDLITMIYDVKTPYLSGPGIGWIMNRSTARLVRQLKDVNENYIWERNTQAGQPELLLGYPVFLSDAIDAATVGNFPIAFGNFRRGYLLADHASGMRITVDDNISTPGQVKFYVRKRLGGIVLNNECLRLQKFADV